MGFLQNVITTELIIHSMSYIFDGAGGMRDQLEQTIMQELELKRYPLKVTIENVKSGGFFGTQEQCVTIEVTNGERVVIANTTVGSYLYVNIYYLKKVLNTQEQINLARANVIVDIFAYQHTQAAYAAAIAATESAFAKLQLKQVNKGYHPLSGDTTNEL